MASANDLRRGQAIDYNGDLCVILDVQHRTPGNLRAFVQASLRSVRTGKSSDVRFSSTEKLEVIPMITRKMEFSYMDQQDYVFSDPETFETVTLSPDLIGDSKNYLTENGPGNAGWDDESMSPRSLLNTYAGILEADLRSRFDAVFADSKARRSSVQARDVELSDESVEQLKELGYLE